MQTTQQIYFSDIQLAARYGVSRPTIWRWKNERGFPEPVHLGGVTRWLLADVEKWECEQGQRDRQSCCL